MTMTWKCLGGLLIATMTLSCANQNESTRPVFGHLLTETAGPLLFFPGIVTQRDQVHFGSSFSDDGKHIVYTVTAKGKPGTIVTQTFRNGEFQPPVPIENDTVYSYSDASISPDGNTILLSSNRPHSADGESDLGSIWRYNRMENRWGNPELIGLEMDSIGGVGFATMTYNKTLYFHQDSANSKHDIFRAEFENGKYLKPERLPQPVNTVYFEGDVFVDKQERFIIFAGFERADNYGLSDLYISFKRGKKWSEPLNMGEKVNSHGYDGSPYVTANDEYLIFTSSRHPEKPEEQEYFNLFYVNFNLSDYQSRANWTD